MKKILTAAALSIAAYAVSAQTTTKVTLQKISNRAVHQLDSLFHYLDTTGYYNGNILVGAGNKKVASASIGYSNLQTRERLSPSSTFELASVSKQFTAFGILRLVAARKITLDEHIETIIPDFPYTGITIRNLLNHTGGLPDYEDMMEANWNKHKIANNDDLLDMLRKMHPAPSFAPGTKWEYSNTGYAVLASVIEKISGKKYSDYMQEQVFTPLHLNHTFIYMRRYAPRAVPGYAYGYVKNEKGDLVLPDSVKELDYVRYLDGIGGDGTVNTTAGDLLAWNNAVRDQKGLPASLWNAATIAPVINGKSTGYGFGFELASSPERGRALIHTGGWPGYVTRDVLYLDKGISLIFLSNTEQPEAIMEGTWNAVKNIVFSLPFQFPHALNQQAAVVDTTIYSKYIGTYVSSEMKGFKLAISTKGGKIYAQATGQAQLEITPETATMFFVAGMPIKMEFKTDGTNAATTMILHQNGDHEFKRE